MGDNAVTSVPVYQAADVLTAANLNITNSGIPVFSGTATRDDAFGGSGEKVLAEGQFAFLEDSNSTQFYDGAVWQPVSSGGMTLISTTTLTGASVSLSSIPQTHKNLQLVIRNFLPATDNQSFTVRVNGDSGANRHFAVPSSTAPTSSNAFNATVWNSNLIGTDNAVTQSLIIWDIFDYTNAVTFKTARAQFAYNNPTTTANVGSELSIYYYNQTTAITSLTLLPSSGNFTSGTVLLYGIS
jgi:hypothetical protein